MGCMGFTWSNQEGNLVIHAGVAYRKGYICSHIYMLRDFRRTRHFQLCLSSVCKAEALWKRWCFQSVLENSVTPIHCCKGLLWWNTWSDSCWRAMKTSSKSGWHHHKYRNLCGYVKCYLLFVPGRRFCFVKFIPVKSWRCAGEKPCSSTL